jgi:uncharacterized protein (TIGR00251 family)
VAPAFWRAVSDGVILAVRVQPKARRPGAHGITETPDGARLKLAVAAPPEDGRANEAALSLLAETWRWPRRALTLAAGAAQRNKSIHVAGDPAALALQLERWWKEHP